MESIVVWHAVDIFITAAISDYSNFRIWQKNVQIIKILNVMVFGPEWRGRLHRCWWRMLETQCVGDNYNMSVTVLLTNIHYLHNVIKL